MSRKQVAGSSKSSKPEKMGEVDTSKTSGSQAKIKSRKSLHVLRKVFHALAGILMAASYEWIFTTQKDAIFFYAIFFALVASCEIMRLYFLDSWISKFVFRFMSILARNYELKQATGMVFFLAGVLSVIVLFPKKVAILAILFLSFGDPLASACGIKLGYLGPKFSNGKSLMGTFGGFLGCAITTFFYYRAEIGFNGVLLLVSLLGGFAGAIPETLCGRVHNGEGGPIDIDDNLALPIGSGLIFYLLLHVFGLQSLMV
mmetsp:Transcript_63370/g.92866  ORF Transcript_63370/g.92866 Transcript_63370/m.92866 type:complete len:258 (-) Transcript_63370:790-1563(-)|eukprot:CAMPEP_0179432478 /NCGR_PEP_ID=MMETSP0799-20121207/17079_1 /TAXON_ID=46947 /ORGANISM="Geminigera cryophila, Strain CCMP2564" /LENGTH=257 /DNA_ID=CAMNT_0021209871 /DNA_START=322 /DNA_END=1095 /DNA_ORIENTATION=+